MKKLLLIVGLFLLTSFNNGGSSDQIGIVSFYGEPDNMTLINMFGYQSYSFNFTLLNSMDGRCYMGSWVAGQGFYYTELKKAK